MSQFGYANPIAVPQRGAASTNAAAVKTIPFDYVFQFVLTGTRGNKVQDVVEISTEGIFVAVSVGYSLVLDERKSPRAFPPVFDQRAAPLAPIPVPFYAGGNLPAGFFVVGMPDAQVSILNLTEGLTP